MIRRNLFTSSFKLYLKRLLGIIAGGILFLLVCCGLNYIYMEDDEISRIVWHNFYEQEGSIDYLYVGSSHVYNGIAPELLDQRTGENHYNMAIGGQKLIEAYYIIKEADHRNQLKGVYLDLYFYLSTGERGNYNDFSVISGGWRGLDYKKFSWDKLDYFFHLNPPKYYINGCLPFTRYREHLCDVEWIYSQQKNKKRPEYRNYQYGWNSEEDQGKVTEKGYFYRTLVYENPCLHVEDIPDNMEMKEDAEEYLRKIVEYCQKEGIAITLFQTPVYELEILAYEEYDDYTASVKSIAEEYNVPYYDFNLIKDEYFPIQDMRYFVDAGHLNEDGAQEFTNFFYEVASGIPTENEKLFFESFQEKLMSEDAKVVGMHYHQGTADELARGEISADMYRVTIASNRERGLQYQIYLTPEGGETVMIQDFSENKYFNIPMEEHGVCRIVWCENGEKENSREMEVGY